MNPVEIEDNIRALELMLYGGAPLHPDPDFGHSEVGYFESVTVRSADVGVGLHGHGRKPETIVESRIIDDDGKMLAGGDHSGNE